MNKKTIFITGATSGIGKSCAYSFAAAGHRLILCGRRSDRLKEIREDLSGLYQSDVLPIELDVRNRSAVEQKVGTLPEGWQKIDILINNAGLALGLSEIGEGDVNEWDQMIDTNIKGLLYVSRAVIPGMMERKSGHIINIGSVAGRETYSKGNVYCATKHAVASITKGMRIDLLPYGIKVSQVSPGAAETEFSLVRFQGDQAKAAEVYKGFKPLTADDIAAAVMFVACLPDHVNVDDMLLMPKNQAGVGLIHREG
jgi:3-hydroxy acid dehydrogenase / malonic semialdehyde reductase